MWLFFVLVILVTDCNKQFICCRETGEGVILKGIVCIPTTCKNAIFRNAKCLYKMIVRNKISTSVFFKTFVTYLCCVNNNGPNQFLLQFRGVLVRWLSCSHRRETTRPLVTQLLCYPRRNYGSKLICAAGRQEDVKRTRVD